MTSDIEPKTPQCRPFVMQTHGFGSGENSPRTFLESCLQELERWEPDVGAFTVLDLQGARRNADASAARWAAGRPWSPIDGMPVGIKDIIDTDDMATENGSVLFKDYRPLFSAASAMALRKAGAVILGKTVTTEFAARAARGTRNPWDLARTPGGSSSGSAAAVASGMIAGAMGTQVVGSIIRPAGYCGVVGYKPSLGGINRGGSHDVLSQSCSGVLAASLADAWAMARSIVAQVGGDPGYVGITGPETLPPPQQPRRLALLQTAGWSQRDQAAAEAFDLAQSILRQNGILIVTREDDAGLEQVEQALETASELTMLMNAWEWRWPVNAYLDRNAAGMSQDARDRAATGRALTQEDYAQALSRRAEIRNIYAKLAGRYDACLTLTAPGVAPIGIQQTGNAVFAVPASLLGVPALALPAMRIDGLPLGLQMIGFQDQDAALFSHAGAVAAFFG